MDETLMTHAFELTEDSWRKLYAGLAVPAIVQVMHQAPNAVIARQAVGLADALVAALAQTNKGA